MEHAAQASGQPPFQEHVELLRRFLAHRDAIVEGIQGVLNAQRKPVEYWRDRRLLSRHIEDCFFARVPGDRSRLRGQLTAAHWARGFKPRDIPGVHNDLVDPAEMARRAFHMWAQTRWPGRNGRVRYAHTLFDLYLIRQLALLGMRVCDAGASETGERLAQAQGVLDDLRRGGPADRPVLVRDVRWLIPVAQSPATDELSPYFEAAERIAATFPEDDYVALQDAVVRMAGGHLRSYLHYYTAQRGVSLDEPALVLIARKSNALDFSILIQGLVPLLKAYERAVHGADEPTRRELADAICQGVSPDPDLFVNRLDLLGAYSMSEHLYTTTDDDGHVAYSAIGRRHVRLLEEYEERIGRMAKALHDDCAQFRPVDGSYSPYGALFGVSSNLLEHMALKTLQPDSVTRFSLEDVFTAGDADKRAWVSGWRKLPHVGEEVTKLYDYPQAFAEQMFERVERALRKRAREGEDAVARAGRIFIVAGDGQEIVSQAADRGDLPLRYVGSSDTEVVAALEAHAYDQKQLLADRLEGHFMVSYATPGGWVAVSKDFLTEILETGRDVNIGGLPATAVERLTLICRGLVAGWREEGADAARRT